MHLTSGHMMKYASVTGRHRPRLKEVVGPDGVTFRVDFRERPTGRAEVRLTWEQVAQLLTDRPPIVADEAL